MRAALPGVIFLLLFFQNCGKFTPDNRASELLAVSAQCTGKIRSKLLSSSQKLTVNCEDIKRYSCEARVFSPHVRSDVFESKVCFNSEILGNTCVSLQTRQFDTSATTGDPESFRVGGEFNHQEYSCYHNSIFEKNIALISGEGDTLRAAMESTFEACRKKVMQ